MLMHLLAFFVTIIINMKLNKLKNIQTPNIKTLQKKFLHNTNIGKSKN